jgi:hypothetical protein
MEKWPMSFAKMIKFQKFCFTPSGKYLDTSGIRRSAGAYFMYAVRISAVL